LLEAVFFMKSESGNSHLNRMRAARRNDKP
jgi:hypothetical protein